jgi:hypothetical protein
VDIKVFKTRASVLKTSYPRILYDIFFLMLNEAFNVLACCQVPAPPRLENPDSDKKDALFGLDTQIIISLENKWKSEV